MPKRTGHLLSFAVPIALVALAGRAAPLALAQAPAAPAGTIDPALFQELRWRSIGPFRGGRVLAVAGVPGEPSHFYFGGVNSGVWETHDAARTWLPIFDGQPIGSIGALAVASSDPKILYVGTGEADMRSSIAQGDGVYKSTDAGKSWRNIGLRDSQQIGKILVDPNNASRLFVAALGHPYGPNSERGVFRSVDGGKTWKGVLLKNADTGAIDLVFKPGNAQIVYASLWQTRRPPWNVYPPSNGPGSGLYKSTDGGESWHELRGNGLPSAPGRIGLATAPADPKRLYAMVDADPARGGLYRSDDEGRTFTRTSGDPRIWGRGWYFGGITVDPRDADSIYACNTSLYGSKDGGKTFVTLKGAPGGDDYHTLWIDPEHPERRILGVDQGAVVSLDAGATWSSWYNQPTGQFYRIATDERFPYRVYGSQQDSGAASVSSRTATIDGIGMMQFREITAGGENDAIAPDPQNPNLVFGGRVQRLDLRTGQTQSLDPTLAYPDNYRSTWTLPLVFSPRDPKTLYFANQRLFRTRDAGASWQRLGADFTREAPGAPPNLDPLTAAHDEGVGARRGVIVSINPSPVLDGDLWVGTDDGLVWRSRDDGTTWVDLTPAGLTPWSTIASIEASHSDPDTAFVAVDRHRLDHAEPFIYRTRDGGRSWSLVASGIPKGCFVNVVREDPARRGLLYAGTEKGVFVSFDEGDHWQSLQLGLPVTSVRDLKVHGDDLVIGTHGRAIWILDGLGPLRQVSPEAGKAAAFLEEPSPAFRVRPEGFTGTPLPKDEPMAPNPLPGVPIDYVLSRTPKSPVTLRILDARGELARSYSSADVVPPADASPRLSPEWVKGPSPLSATPGMHRFFWPLRYAASRTDEKPDAFADGVWAPPGRYVAELTVDGQVYSRPLLIEPDPRAPLAAEVYARQFDLARRIESAKVQANRATQEAATLHQALVERAKGAEKASAEKLAVLDRRVLDLSELDLSMPGIWPGPAKNLSGLRFLGNQLESLLEAVDGADTDPGEDVRKAFAQITSTQQQTLRSWDALKDEVKRFLASMAK